MATFNPAWDAAWTAAIDNQTIGNGGSYTSPIAVTVANAAYDVSVEVTYGSPANEGIKLYILGDIDNTNFEAVADGAWGFEMEKTVSTKHYKRFSIQGLDISKFKFHVTNDSGAQVTGVYVRYKKASVQSS